MPEGGNEITAARALLETLALEGMLVAGDATHAQAAPAGIIRDRGGDYLLALKANHPLLLAEITTTDAGHGRTPTRHHRVSHDVDWLFSDRRDKGEPAMPGLCTLACVTSTREISGKTTIATRYYLSSARLTPERFATAVRAHWAIENSLHWVLDVTFDEDRARNRKDHGPENLATLCKLTLNLLRKTRPKLPISRKRKRVGLSDAFARSILGQMR